MENTCYAAIDIGSNAARLLIKKQNPKDSPKKNSPNYCYCVCHKDLVLMSLKAKKSLKRKLKSFAV